MAGEFMEMVRADEQFERMLDAAVLSPRGYAYIRIAALAQLMGVSLAHCWNVHGNRLLESLEEAVERQNKSGETSAQ